MDEDVKMDRRREVFKSAKSQLEDQEFECEANILIMESQVLDKAEKDKALASLSLKLENIRRGIAAIKKELEVEG